MRLHLQIGLGKAGSSSIQNFLVNFSSLLDEKGILVLNRPEKDYARLMVASEGSPNTKRYFVEKCKLMNSIDFKNNRASFWSEIEKEFIQQKYHTVVGSCEFFHSLLDTEDKIVWLKKNLDAYFEEVKIIFYVRDQVDLVKSFYAQNVKGSSKITYRYDSDEFLEIASEASWFFDFYNQIGKWSKIFGRQNISLGVLDEGWLKNGSLIDDYCWRSGIFIEERYLSKRSVKKVNKSPSYFNLLLLRYNNMLRKKSDKFRKFCDFSQRMASDVSLGGNFPNTLDIKIYEQFDNSNRKLANHFLNFDGNPFSKPPY